MADEVTTTRRHLVHHLAGLDLGAVEGALAVVPDKRVQEGRPMAFREGGRPVLGCAGRGSRTLA
jgi:hypothetical protein